jgi:hypothetical protein
VRALITFVVVAAAALLLWLFTTPKHRAWLDAEDEDY